MIRKHHQYNSDDKAMNEMGWAFSTYVNNSSRSYKIFCHSVFRISGFHAIKNSVGSEGRPYSKKKLRLSPPLFTTLRTEYTIYISSS